MNTTLIETSSPTYMRRMVRELNSLCGRGGFYVLNSEAFCQRFSWSKFSKGRLLARIPLTNGQFCDITARVDEISDANGRHVCATRRAN